MNDDDAVCRNMCIELDSICSELDGEYEAREGVFQALRGDSAMPNALDATIKGALHDGVFYRNLPDGKRLTGPPITRLPSQSE